MTFFNQITMATKQPPPPTPTPPPPPPPPPPRRPKKIRPLPKEVVDRIAAGEVVQRPVSVVKELIENSLDADGTQIDIQTQRGGLDSITVTDNGHGISPRSLPLACTRFATSKLVEVDDLKSIRTFGFRGEALASASMVARVGITSRVRPRVNKSTGGANDDSKVGEEGEGSTSSTDEDTKQPQHNCAYKMHYKDGAPNPSTNPNLQPKPSAGREGTVIQVQDLFYNIPSRRRAFEGRRSEREEYDRILGVVQRYAVHEAKRGVGFLCRGGSKSAGGNVVRGKKAGGRGGFGGGNHTDLNTQSLASVKKLQERRKKSSAGLGVRHTQKEQFAATEEEMIAATKDVIGHVFGAAVTRELLPLAAGEGDVEAVSVAALKAMVQKKEGDGSLSVDMDELNESVQDQSAANDGDSKENSNEFNNSLLEEMMMGSTNHDPSSNHTTKSDKEPSSKDASSTPSKFAFAYRATGLITNGSYSTPKSSSAFLLFINDRLVESSSLRRAIESVYSDTLPKGGKPFVYLSLELPGPHVDVNVHPTKREVALLHEEKLCEAVSKAVRSVIGGAEASKTFSVLGGGRLLPKEEQNDQNRRRSEMARKQTAAVAAMEGSESLMKNGVDAADVEKENLGKENTVNMGGDEEASSSKKELASADTGESNNASLKQQQSDKKTPKKRAADEDESKAASSTAKKRPYYDPSRLVRTNRSLPVGALEPFLVKKDDKSSSSEKKDGLSRDDTMKPTNEAASATMAVKHKPECPLASNPSGQQVDMTMPGAFASAICRCQVERSESLPPVPNNGIIVRNPPNTNIVRPKKITPTHCDYESINNLRTEITHQNHQGFNEMLRGSIYVGAVSRYRSLIQYNIDLLMINHRELAREMFYQIALMKFNGMGMAKLGGGGVDVTAAIGQMLQFEEDLNSSSTAGAELKKSSLDNGTSAAVKVNKTNIDLARQATACLASKASMLEEYFSIKLEKVDVLNKKRERVTSLRLTGLPILLEGHSPQPHGLPLFLQRLATEVDWTEEEPCFRGVCMELASFYSELPFASSDNASKEGGDLTSQRDGNDSNKEGTGKKISELIDDEAKNYVKHTLFPAISYLLVPSEKLADNNVVVKLANLTSLYKVFERC